MEIKKITTENFQQEVINSKIPVLLDFYADWCGPCKMLTPFLEEIASEREDIQIGKVNVDENMELALQFQVSSIPLLVLMKNGEAAGRLLGFRPKEQILALISE